jgi:hypothetical protein
MNTADSAWVVVQVSGDCEPMRDKRGTARCETSDVSAGVHARGMVNMQACRVGVVGHRLTHQLLQDCLGWGKNFDEMMLSVPT